MHSWVSRIWLLRTIKKYVWKWKALQVQSLFWKAHSKSCGERNLIRVLKCWKRILNWLYLWLHISMTVNVVKNALLMVLLVKVWFFWINGLPHAHLILRKLKKFRYLLIKDQLFYWLVLSEKDFQILGNF